MNDEYLLKNINFASFFVNGFRLHGYSDNGE